MKKVENRTRRLNVIEKKKEKQKQRHKTRKSKEQGRHKLTITHQLGNSLILSARDFDIVDCHDDSEELCFLSALSPPSCIHQRCWPAPTSLICFPYELEKSSSYGNKMRSRRTETEEAGNERDKGKPRTLASAAASQLIGMVAVFEVLCGSTGSCRP
jgi:hypothetical protein